MAIWTPPPEPTKEAIAQMVFEAANLLLHDGDLSMETRRLAQRRVKELMRAAREADRRIL